MSPETFKWDRYLKQRGEPKSQISFSPWDWLLSPQTAAASQAPRASAAVEHLELKVSAACHYPWLLTVHLNWQSLVSNNRGVCRTAHAHAVGLCLSKSWGPEAGIAPCCYSNCACMSTSYTFLKHMYSNIPANINPPQACSECASSRTGGIIHSSLLICFLLSPSYSTNIPPSHSSPPIPGQNIFTKKSWPNDNHAPHTESMTSRWHKNEHMMCLPLSAPTHPASIPQAEIQGS